MNKDPSNSPVKNQKNTMATTTAPTKLSMSVFSSPEATPETIAQFLEKRSAVETRLQRRVDVTTHGPTETTPDVNPALDAALNRHELLDECTRVISWVSVRRDSGVDFPAFLSVPSLRLTLQQLRDIADLQPVLQQLEANISAQCSEVSHMCDEHNARVQRDLEAAKRAVRDRFKADVEQAKSRGKEPPSELELEALLTEEETLFAPKLARKCDPVGVRTLLTTLKQWTAFLTKERNRAIDEANAIPVTDVVEEIATARAAADLSDTPGSPSESKSDEATDSVTVSLAALPDRKAELLASLNAVVQHIPVVSWFDGQEGNDEAKLQDPSVLEAEERLTKFFTNCHIWLAMCQAHKELLVTRFVRGDAINGYPVAVDTLIRYGYTEAPRSRARAHARRAPMGRVSLHNTLTQFIAHLEAAQAAHDEDIATHKESVDEAVREAHNKRNGNGAPVKPGELDAIAEAVRSANAQPFSIAADIDSTLDRAREILARVETLQSAARKEVISTTKTTVPKPLPMEWASSASELDGW